jgi:osmotically-inducible protein OsmY
MRAYIPISVALTLSLLALPAFANDRPATAEESAADANSFLNATLIAISHGQVRIIEPGGRAQTLRLEDNATIQQPLKEGSDVILAIKGRGAKSRVTLIRAAHVETAVERLESAQEERREAQKPTDSAGPKTRAIQREAVPDIAKGVTIGAELKAALSYTAALDASDIDIAVDDDARTITLQGTVPQLGQKATAERIAYRHAHGYEVHDALIVILK